MMSAGRLIFKVRKVFFTALSIIVSIHGAFFLVTVQAILKFIYKNNLTKLQYGLNWTKRGFIILLVSVLNIVAPSSVRITTEDETIPRGTFIKDLKKGRIVSHLNKKSVMICNHQIYTDWVFLWWITYTSNLAGNVYIMLKKSLEFIPILGYGMKNYRFIFLCRKWAVDRLVMNNQLGEIDADARGCGIVSGSSPKEINEEGEESWDTSIIGDRTNVKWPYSVILFPEGTNMSVATRQKSKEFAAKVNRKPYENVLLPRSTGLRFTLQKLSTSIDVVYDVTIGYSGVKKDEYGELIYRLPKIFLEGKMPKLIDIHMRALKIEDIPIDDEDKFNNWLYDIWQEKDELMEFYYKNGTFKTNENCSEVTDFFTISNLEFIGALSLPFMTLFLFLFTVLKIFN
ncbi:hypothetical protein Kpol_1037p58 [Vanderwaltozyma polyspora DSM 70294]|uniref:Phospholipid/glycerol acyltransferase domain-containing protein n=1 Tax=Vanderwaltozyma polyspora (strain ATCC 22028 / DSM 70294 / BCRC 21397 / CBS 2163 / NBRC 10782 / NRRL Y-8283 / UCD 57-17) TaxID=436907 RepID=A7TJZ9_VANPO|nr:uncharacterized protein Kpol_1037p58 [Vanderwaltozyma polyspora DSM 70294]EDO17461.1 hypothetical protein Kpol_1037p58 [Vanderwaltozyma polyspora DSM 70294]